MSLAGCSCWLGGGPCRQTAFGQVAFKLQVARLKITRLCGAGGSADDQSRLLSYVFSLGADG